MEVRIIENAYKLYKDARDASWRCLIRTGAAELPIKVLKIAGACGVRVAKDSAVQCLEPEVSGCTLFDESGWQIIYRDSENRGRTRFTIAHELGHILLGHELAPDKSGHFRTASDRREPAETQADEFAARLLAPACVLWGLECYEPEDIMRVCDISKEAAQYRSERMKVLRDRGKFLTSPLERQVYEAFKPWIEQQKGRPE